ncbi:MAG: cyclic dehypoxanthinyl futalosine synthase [Bacteroidales bacterium]
MSDIGYQMADILHPTSCILHLASYILHPYMDELIIKALASAHLTINEGAALFRELPLASLMWVGNEIRRKNHPQNIVTWIIDRNVNITNACVSGCKFCNFYKPVNNDACYITSIEEYVQKIDEMHKLGGNQLLLQGGMHPHLGIGFYTNLFSSLKKLYPTLRLHALGPPEIVHLAKMEKLSNREVLEQLVVSGMTSLPGAGAEILVDRVRREISPVKCSASEWLAVMEQAHIMDLTTSATMMFGHIETLEERLEHMVAIRQLQSRKPAGHKGFLSFIPWPFQDEGTVLQKKSGIKNHVTSEEYIRMIAISRIMLPNIQNIQASWLTVGKETAQLCLYAGANDFGSIMIEENVVSAAGAHNSMNADRMQQAISDAGFTPRLRNQDFVLQ